MGVSVLVNNVGSFKNEQPAEKSCYSNTRNREVNQEAAIRLQGLGISTGF